MNHIVDTENPMSIPHDAQEAYKKGNIAVVVHFRKDREVYFHRQKWDDTWISFNNFARMPESDFEQLIAKEGAEKFDPQELPCNSQPMPDDGWD